jgi:GPH family glycoside/pentoside/hexuronide:cation symporter
VEVNMKDRNKDTVHKVRSEDHIRFGQMAAYAAGGIIPVALFNIAGQLIGIMGNISLGLSAFWLGLIMIIPRLWDAISDPVVGHLSDNTRTRWGRRRPYLLIGGVAVAVFFVVMWWIPKGDTVRVWFPSDSGYQTFQLIYILFALLLFFTSTTIFEIPHGALGMEMTTDPHERTRLFSAKSFIGNLFAMSTPWLFALANTPAFRGPGGNEADGMRYVSLLIAAIIIPLSVWWSAKLREPGFVRVSKQEKTPFWKDMKHTVTNRNFIFLVMTIFTLAMGFNFVNLLGSYIPIFYVFGGDKVAGARLLGINGTVWAITGVLAVFPLNWISPKLGKRNTLLISMVLMCLAQLSKIICYNPHHPYLVLIPTILLSAGMLFFFTLGSSMVGDICDEEELKKGQRTEGSYYAIYWWFIKLGTAFASFVAGILITITLFDETQVIKVDSLQGSIREMKARVQYWEGYKGLSTANPEWIKKAEDQTSEALKESGDYLKYLEKGTAKKPDRKKKISLIDQGHRKNLLLNALSATRSSVTGLEQMQQRLGNLDPQSPDSVINRIILEAIPLSIQTNLVKARVNSFDLLTHLEAKAHEARKSAEHYKMLIENISGLNKDLAAINTTDPPEMIGLELVAIESRIVPLKKQTPYTLLRMRIVEIGLPFLLSIVAIILALRYSLTEKRTNEIKELLRQRREGINGTLTGTGTPSS